jgi:hypothetical protein
MGAPKKSSPSLIDLPVRDRETSDIAVVVETQKGSHDKHKHDGAGYALRLGAVLAEGLSFRTISASCPRPWAKTAIRSTCWHSSITACRRS